MPPSIEETIRVIEEIEKAYQKIIDEIAEVDMRRRRGDFDQYFGWGTFVWYCYEPTGDDREYVFTEKT